MIPQYANELITKNGITHERLRVWAWGLHHRIEEWETEMMESDKLVSQYSWDEWGASTYSDRNIRITSATTVDEDKLHDEGDWY